MTTPGHPHMGVDLGGTKCLVAWMDSDGSVITTERFPSPTDPEEFVADIAKLAQLRPVRSIGVGVPGFVDRDRRTVLRCPNLPRYVRVPMANMLAAATGVPVVLENDANAAAVAEARLGAGQGIDDLLFVILGSGVGGGLISSGSLVRGVGFAGEIGHLTVDPDGPVCGCGRRGCWELYASGRALARLAGRSTGEEVNVGLANRESWAIAALAQYVESVAEGLADLTLILAPEAIIIGGGVSEIGAELTTNVQAALTEMLPSFVHTPAVVTAQLGNDAGVIGAALLGMEDSAR